MPNEIPQEGILQSLGRAIPMALGAATDIRTGRNNISPLVQKLLPPTPEEQMMMDLRKSNIDKDKLAGILGLAKEERLEKKETREQERLNKLNILNESLAKTFEDTSPEIANAIRLGEMGLASTMLNIAARGGAKPVTEADFLKNIIANDRDLAALNMSSERIDKDLAVDRAKSLANIHQTDASSEFKQGLLTVYQDNIDQERVLAAQEKEKKSIFGSDPQGNPIFKNKTDAKAFIKRIKDMMGNDLIFKLRKQNELGRFVQEEIHPLMPQHFALDDIINELLGIKTGTPRAREQISDLSVFEAKFRGKF